MRLSGLPLRIVPATASNWGVSPASRGSNQCSEGTAQRRGTRATHLLPPRHQRSEPPGEAFAAPPRSPAATASGALTQSWQPCCRCPPKSLRGCHSAAGPSHRVRPPESATHGARGSQRTFVMGAVSRLTDVIRSPSGSLITRRNPEPEPALSGDAHVGIIYERMAHFGAHSGWIAVLLHLQRRIRCEPLEPPAAMARLSSWTLDRIVRPADIPWYSFHALRREWAAARMLRSGPRAVADFSMAKVRFTTSVVCVHGATLCPGASSAPFTSRPACLTRKSGVALALTRSTQSSYKRQTRPITSPLG